MGEGVTPAKVSDTPSALPCICLPVHRNGLVVGGLQLLFSSTPSAEIREFGYAEITAVAAELFFEDYDLPSGQMSKRSVRSRSTSSKRNSAIIGNLTPRQFQILSKLGTKETYAEIARGMSFSESTIKKEAAIIFDYLGAFSREEAYRIAVERGLIENDQ